MSEWELLPDGRRFTILPGSHPACAYVGGLDANGAYRTARKQQKAERRMSRLVENDL